MRQIVENRTPITVITPFANFTCLVFFRPHPASPGVDSLKNAGLGLPSTPFACRNRRTQARNSSMYRSGTLSISCIARSLFQWRPTPVQPQGRFSRCMQAGGSPVAVAPAGPQSQLVSRGWVSSRPGLPKEGLASRVTVRSRPSAASSGAVSGSGGASTSRLISHMAASGR